MAKKKKRAVGAKQKTANVAKRSDETIEKNSGPRFEWLPAQVREFVTPVNVALALVVLLAVAIRAYRLAEPFGGFHAFNEAFYTTEGRLGLSKGFLAIAFSPTNFNCPPLYAMLLSISFRLFGVGEASARIVSVLASALSVVYVYKLAKVLYNEKIGLLAATVLAFSPGDVLVGRNVQVESLLVFFILASAYYLVRGIRENSTLLAGVGGALLGLGLITKLPVVLSIPAFFAWETWRRRSLKWLLGKTTLAFLAAFAVVGLPWYLYHLIANSSAFMGAQSSLAQTFLVPDAYFFETLLYNELLWMLSPPIFFASLAALAWMLYKRQPSDVLVALLLAVNIAFYCFYHFHTYYLIPVAPFAAVALARGIYSLKFVAWKRVTAAAFAVAIVSISFSFILLGGQKYGKTACATLEEKIGLDPDKLTIQVGKAIKDNQGPVLDYYTKRAKIIGYPPASGEQARSGDRVVTLDLLRPNTDSSRLMVLPEDNYGLVLFGYSFSQTPARRHFFANGEIVVEQVGPVYGFGLDKQAYESPYAIYATKTY